MAETPKSGTGRINAINAEMKVLFSKMDDETTAYESAYKAGDKVAFCEHTGRAYAYTVKFKAKVDEAQPLLASNGAAEDAKSMLGLSERLTGRINALVNNYGVTCPNLTRATIG